MMFLETLAGVGATDPAQTAMLIAFFAAYALVMSIIGIAVWVYTSFAFMAIAKKLNQATPGLAWIPGIGPLIVAYKASGMKSWPWWLLLGYIVMLIPFIGFIGWIALVVFAVYAIIWTWKMLDAVGSHGAWVLINLVPFVGGIIYLVILGIAAWGK
jgi:hypothetical protein